MSSEVTAAIIAAVVSVLGSGITLFFGLRNVKIEKEKLHSERERLQADRERLQAELRQTAEQSRIGKVEIAKLKAETEKIMAETSEIKRHRLEAERNEIRDILGIFERAVFDAPMQSEEPVEMFKAIQQTRISLQLSGATLIRDQEVAEIFCHIREILLRIEGEVQVKFPIVAQMATQFDNRNFSGWEQREKVREILGGDYFEPVRMMMDIRREIQQHLERVHNRLRELDSRIG